MKKVLKRIAILMCILLAMNSILLFNNVQAVSDELKDDKNYTAKVKNTTTMSARGSQIQVTEITPQGKTAPMALVVMCHGYTGNRRGDGDAFITLGKKLAENGIAAITLDFPGCGDSTEASQYYTIGNMNSDISSAINYMKSNYNIADGEIGITGHSMGGRIAAINSNKAKALALWAPANGEGSNACDFLSRGSFDFTPGSSFRSEMESSTPNSNISSFSGPLLIAYDSADTDGTGPLSPETVSGTKQAFENSPSTNKKWLDYSDNHNFDSSRSTLINETANMFAKYFVGHEINDTNKSKIYTIEDIVFNRVPILDVNFFSDKAGGESISEGSIIYKIRNVVATWYVSFRNLVIVALAIILVYIGIRLAMSTIAERKANYKRLIIGWLKALIIVMIVHYLMYIVLTLNSDLVQLISETSINANVINGYGENSMYDTIKTRALDIRAGVGIGSFIIYIVLWMTWFRFLWVYTKRMFTVLLLVVIAPFIGAKYAIDSASGKKGSSFTSWLTDFTMNVFLQSVHALVYTVFISTVLSLSQQSIMGYVLSLVFMNFMLSADEIFRNIFNFNKSKLMQDAAKIQNFKDIKKELAGGIFALQLAKGTIGAAKGVGEFAVNTGKNAYKDLTKYNPNIKKDVTEFQNNTDRSIEDFIVSLKGNPNTKNPIIKVKNDMLKSAEYSLKIRRLSRKKGTLGIKAKKLKKKQASLKKKKYTSNFKIIKTTATGMGSIFLAVPLTVVNTTAGMAMLTSGINTMRKIPSKKDYSRKPIKGAKSIPTKVWRKVTMADTRYARDEEKKKYIKKRDKLYNAIDNLNQINEQEEEIKQELNTIKSSHTVNLKDIGEYKETASVLLVEASSSRIDEIIENYIEENNIDKLDKSSIDDIIEEVVDKIGDNMKLSQSAKENIISRAKSSILQINQKRKKREQQNMNFGGTQDNEITFSNDDIRKSIQRSGVDSMIKKEFRKTTNKMFELDTKIDKLEDLADTNYSHSNKFLRNL